MLLNTKPLFNKKQMTNNKYRNYARKLLITKYFDPFIQVCIGLNIFILMLKYVGMPEGLIQFITIMNDKDLTLLQNYYSQYQKNKTENSKK